MDPNELLRMIDEAINKREHGNEVDIWCQDLFDWLAKGGFDPEWNKYPLGTSYFHCRAVYHKRGERVPEEKADGC